MSVSLLSPVGLLIHTSTVSPLVIIVFGVPFIIIVGLSVVLMAISFYRVGLIPNNTHTRATCVPSQVWRVTIL